jgi:zinc transporter ZupT
MSPLPLVNLKIAAIFAILVASAVGASLPLVIARCVASEASRRRVQVVIKLMTCVSVGIVLATALIHVVPDGLEQLRESGVAPFAKRAEAAKECAPSSNSSNQSSSSNRTANGTTSAPAAVAGGDDDDDDDAYPYGFLFAMIAIVVVFVVSSEVNLASAMRIHDLDDSLVTRKEERERLAALTKLYAVEFGVAIHSVIIGVNLGLTRKYDQVVTLTIVLCVHQLFEGLAIGSLAVLSRVTPSGAAAFVGCFMVTTPLGVAIGTATSNNSSVVTQGIVSCLAAGVLLHMALTEMLPDVLGSHAAQHAHGPLPIEKLRASLIAVAADDAPRDEDPPPRDSAHSRASRTVPAGREVVAGDAPTADCSATEEAPPSKRKRSSFARAAIAETQSPAAAYATFVEPRSAALDDDDGETEAAPDGASPLLRFACYAAIIFGASVQSVLGIWA